MEQVPDKPDDLLDKQDLVKICVTKEEIVETKAAASNLRFGDG